LKRKCGNGIRNKNRMTFKTSFCDPFKPDIVDWGEVDKEEVIEAFEGIAWTDLLKQMLNKSDSEIYYSPSFEVLNTKNQHSLAISVVGDPNTYEWYVFYKRPKVIKGFLGFSRKTDPAFLTNVTGQTKKDVLQYIQALLEENHDLLDQKIK